MPMVNELEALANRSHAAVILHAVADLKEQGNSRAGEVLDFYEEHRLEFKGCFLFKATINGFVAEHRDVLFKDEEEICGVLVGRLTMLFPAANTVTFKYGIGEDNFGAIGVTFTMVGGRLVPYYIQVHDRTGFNLPIEYVDDGTEVSQVLEYAFSFMKNDDEQVLYPEPGNNTNGIMTYPLVDPRISLHPDNCDTEQHTKTREAIFSVLNAVKVLAPNTHLMITASWNGSHNIDTNVFRLRTYDYHDSDETLTWNFVWRDVAVQWYKHPGRCLTINRLLSDDELAVMADEVISALATYKFEPEPRKFEPATRESPEKIATKLMNNSISGPFHSPHAQKLDEEMLTAALRSAAERKKQLLDK